MSKEFALGDLVRVNFDKIEDRHSRRSRLADTALGIVCQTGIVMLVLATSPYEETTKLWYRIGSELTLVQKRS